MVCERFNKTLKEKIWRVFTHNSIQKQKFPQNYKKFIQEIYPCPRHAGFQQNNQ